MLSRLDRMRTALRALGAGALLAARAHAGTLAAAAPGLTLSACELEHPLRLTVAGGGVRRAVGCRESDRTPQAGTSACTLRAWPRSAARKQADPLFVLAGGPGAAATTFYATVAGAFARIHRDRDIVLIDQRGTGRSNPLDCEADEALLYRATDTEIARQTRRCLTRLSARADVAYYTSSLAVQDLERVRAALSARAHQPVRHLLWHAGRAALPAPLPARVRAVILDGVVPAPLALGPATATNAEQALLSILARCAGEPACGKPLRRSRARLPQRACVARNHAVPVALADPSSGDPTRFSFSTAHLATVLRLASYTPEYAALLPLMLDDAAAHQDYAPLAAQFLLVERGYAEALATGMHNSVVCTEDVPFYDPRAIDRERLADTFLGTLQLDGLDTVCRIWPHGPIDADFHAPLAERRAGVAAVGERRSGHAAGLRAPCGARFLARPLDRARRLRSRSADRPVHGSRARAVSRTRLRGRARCQLHAPRASAAVLHLAERSAAVRRSRPFARDRGALSCTSTSER